MKKLKVLWFLSSILFIINGIISLLNPTSTIISLAIIFGLSMLIKGIIDIYIYAKYNKYILSSSSILVDGIITIILSLLILFNKYLIVSIIPILFSIWLLFSGISQIVEAIEFRQYKVENWWLYLLLGIIESIISVMSVFKPIATAVALSTIIGVAFIATGISLLVKGITINKFVKELKELL